MKRLIYLLPLLSILFAGKESVGQGLFVGKIVYKHSLTKSSEYYPIVDSTVLSSTKDLSLIERFYNGNIVWSYPAIEVVTTTERLFGYSNNKETVFASANEVLTTEILSSEDVELVLGYACKKIMTKKMMPTGVYLKRNYIVATNIPQDGFSALFPKELAGMPLVCEIIYEDKQGKYLFSEIIEAVRVEKNIDETKVKDKIIELNKRKRVAMNQENFKKEMGVSNDLNSSVECKK